MFYSTTAQLNRHAYLACKRTVGLHQKSTPASQYAWIGKKAGAIFCQCEACDISARVRATNETNAFSTREMVGRSQRTSWPLFPSCVNVSRHGSARHPKIQSLCANRPITLRKRITGRLVSISSGKDFKESFPSWLLRFNVGRLLDTSRFSRYRQCPRGDVLG